MGYTSPFLSAYGGQELAFVDPDLAAVVQIRRDHIKYGNVFFHESLPWVLMHESQHTVQLAGLGPREANERWHQNRQVFQHAADRYADLNYVPGVGCPVTVLVH